MNTKVGIVVLLTLLAGGIFSVSSKDFSDISLSGNWFLAYDFTNDDAPDNEFLLKRGYFTVQSKLSNSLSFRLTQDVSVDREGDGEGDIEIRLKYGYLKYSVKQLWMLHKVYSEFGVVHRPWIDFEQKINPYRVQGSMFLERTGILRSADYGITVGGLFGGTVDSSYMKSVSKDYPGKYGSFCVGVYNGGGYEATEQNENKYVEGRLTIRPLPQQLTGLQFSFFGGYGKSNTAESPDFSFSSLFLSYQNRRAIVSGTYYNGIGDLRGRAVDTAGRSLNQDGYSAFSEIGLLPLDLKVFGRYDRFRTESAPEDISQSRYIAGIAYYLVKGSKILIDYDYLPDAESGTNDVSVFEFAVEMKF